MTGGHNMQKKSIGPGENHPFKPNPVLLDIEAMKRRIVEGFCTTPHTRDLPELKRETVGVPPPGYDQEGFRRDMYYLIKGAGDPQKTLELLQKFINTYIYPTRCLSLLVFDKAGDRRSYKILNGPESAGNVWELTKKEWQIENPKSIISYCLAQEPNSFFTIRTFGIYKIKENAGEEIFAKNAHTPQKIYDDISASCTTFDDPKFKAIDLAIVYNRDLVLQKKIVSKLIIPIYTTDRQIKAVIYAGFRLPAVLLGDIVFPVTSLLDVQLLIGILQLCLT